MKFSPRAVVSIPTLLVGVVGGLDATPALAEFQIQEAGIEKGEIELEYRGAYHWGVPQVTDENENANDLIQSHELELSYGLTNWWLLQFTTGFEQPLGEDLRTSDVEFETEFALIKREGNGVALSFQGGYEKAVNQGDSDDPDQFGFGPIIELAKDSLLITLNPLFTKQSGKFADQEGLGFEYGWRAEYDFAKHWGLGVEMFGEIESLADSGSFDQQNHSIGPTLFYKPDGNENDNTNRAGGNDENSGDSRNVEMSLNVGLQFGLTDATSDTALKFQGSLSF